MKERIKFIDIDKGLLIIIVIMHHILGLMISFNVLPYSYITLEKVYVPFFMPAFFIVTGYCSNFNKPHYIFLISNIKTLLIPSFIFYFIDCLIELCIDNTLSTTEVLLVFYRIIYLGGAWFLVALFLAKEMFWFICNYRLFKTTLSQNIIVILACATASIAYSMSLPEPWYIYHAMGLLLFVYLGYLLKERNMLSSILNRKILLWIAFTIYIIYDSSLFYYNLHLPRISMKFSLYIYEIPFFIIGAVAGSLIILGISKYINNNRFLEFFGRNSLAVYLTHWVIIKFIISSTTVIADKYLPSFVYFLFVLLLTCITCSIIIHILNNKAFRWMLGKF